MSKENELTKYENEHEKQLSTSNDVFKFQEENIAALKGDNIQKIAELEKLAEEKKKLGLAEISKIEEKCKADLSEQEKILEENLASVKSERQENRNALTKKTNEVKKIKAISVENITMERNNIEETNKKNVADQLASYNKIVNSTNKEISKLEEDYKKKLDEYSLNSKAIEDSINEKIKEANNCYFSTKKKLEDKAKKDITAKNTEIVEKNKTLDDKITFVGKEFLGNQKTIQETISSTTASKVEIAEANKKLKAFTSAKDKEIALLEKQKVTNEQERLAYEKTINSTLEKEIAAKRIETIDIVTKLQAEIDVNAKKALIDNLNMEDTYKNDMNVLLLRQMKEKFDNDKAICKQSNLYESSLEQQRNASLIAEQLENLGVESIRVDREYDEASFDANALDATQNIDLTKETISCKMLTEKEAICSENDLTDISLKHDVKDIKIEEQKQIYEFMKPVMSSNVESLNKATLIVNEFKKKRVEKAIIPFIDAINKKLDSFIKKYNDLINEQTIEFEKTLKMLDKAYQEKINYLHSSKSFIEGTDGLVVSGLADLEKKETLQYEASVKQLTEMNDTIIKLYNDKIASDTEEANKEIERMNKLNEEVINQISINDDNEKTALNNSYTNNGTFTKIFDEYYQEQKMINDKYTTDSITKRKNLLDSNANEISDRVKNFADNVLSEKKKAAESLDQLADSCNLSRENLKNEYDRFISKNANDYASFESQLNIQYKNLEDKSALEYSTKEATFNDEKKNRSLELQKKIKSIEIEINNINKKIPSNISFNNKNAQIEKNKKWWVVERG